MVEHVKQGQQGCVVLPSRLTGPVDEEPIHPRPQCEELHSSHQEVDPMHESLQYNSNARMIAAYLSRFTYKTVHVGDQRVVQTEGGRLNNIASVPFFLKVNEVWCRSECRANRCMLDGCQCWQLLSDAT